MNAVLEHLMKNYGPFSKIGMRKKHHLLAGKLQNLLETILSLVPFVPFDQKLLKSKSIHPLKPFWIRLETRPDNLNFTFLFNSLKVEERNQWCKPNLTRKLSSVWFFLTFWRTFERKTPEFSPNLKESWRGWCGLRAFLSAKDNHIDPSREKIRKDIFFWLHPLCHPGGLSFVWNNVCVPFGEPLDPPFLDGSTSMEREIKWVWVRSPIWRNLSTHQILDGGRGSLAN